MKKYNEYWVKKRKPFGGVHHKKDMHDEVNQAFYVSAEWIRLRDTYRKNNPLCIHCKAIGNIAPADVVDHIVGITDDYSLRLDYNNLQSLCHKHHLIKENEERRKRKQAAKDRLTKEVMNNLNDFE